MHPRQYDLLLARAQDAFYFADSRLFSGIELEISRAIASQNSLHKVEMLQKVVPILAQSDLESARMLGRKIALTIG